jgi:hypothetical protein
MGGQIVEGMSPLLFWGVLLWYPALLVCAITTLVAFGLLLAGRTAAARIVFASGLLCPALATLPLFVAWLEAAVNTSRFGDSMPLVLLVLGEISLVAAGVGPFVASLRSGRAFAVALGCALGAAACVVAAGLCDSDFCYRVLGEQLATTLFRQRLPLEIVGLALAVTSLLVAILLPAGAKQAIRRPQE